MGNKSRSQAKPRFEQVAQASASASGYEMPNLIQDTAATTATPRRAGRSSENKLSKPQATTSISGFKISSSGQVNEEKVRESDSRHPQLEQWPTNNNNRESRNSMELDYDRRENPSKITHGFWLQQYSCLHKDTSLGCATSSSTSQQQQQQQQQQQIQQQQQPAHPSQHNPTTDTLYHSSPTNQPARYRQHDHASHLSASPIKAWNRRRKLLNKWNNLVKSLGGSTSENINQFGSETTTAQINVQSQYGDKSGGARGVAGEGDDKLSESFERVGGLGHVPHSSNTRLPDFSTIVHPKKEYNNFSKIKSPSKSGGATIKGHEEESANIREREQYKRNKSGRSWFMKSLSNSTSTLLASFNNHLPTNLNDTSNNKRSQLKARATAQAQQQQTAGQVRSRFYQANQDRRSQSSCETSGLGGGQERRGPEGEVEKFVGKGVGRNAVGFSSNEQLLANDLLDDGSTKTPPGTKFGSSDSGKLADVGLEKESEDEESKEVVKLSTRRESKHCNRTNSPYKQIAMVLTGMSPIKQLRKRVNNNNNDNDNSNNSRSRSQQDSGGGGGGRTCGGSSAGNILGQKARIQRASDSSLAGESVLGDENECEFERGGERKQSQMAAKRGRLMQFAIARSSHFSSTTLSSKGRQRGSPEVVNRGGRGNILATENPPTAPSPPEAEPIELEQQQRQRHTSKNIKTKQTGSHLLQSIFVSPKLFKRATNTQDRSPTSKTSQASARIGLDQDSCSTAAAKSDGKREVATKEEPLESTAGTSDKRRQVQQKAASKKIRQEQGELVSVGKKLDEIDLSGAQSSCSSIFPSGKSKIVQGGISQLIEREEGISSISSGGSIGGEDEKSNANREKRSGGLKRSEITPLTTTYNTIPTTLLGQSERVQRTSCEEEELTSKEVEEKSRDKQVNPQCRESSNFKRNTEQEVKLEEERAQTQLDLDPFPPRFPRFGHEKREYYANEFQGTTTTTTETTTTIQPTSATETERKTSTTARQDVTLNGTDEDVRSALMANKEPNLANKNQENDSYVLSENCTRTRREEFKSEKEIDGDAEKKLLNVGTFPSSTWNKSDKENDGKDNGHPDKRQAKKALEVEHLEERQQQQLLLQESLSEATTKVGRQEPTWAQAGSGTVACSSQTRRLEETVEKRFARRTEREEEEEEEEETLLEETSTKLGRAKCSEAIQRATPTTASEERSKSLTATTTTTTSTTQPSEIASSEQIRVETKQPTVLMMASKQLEREKHKGIDLLSSDNKSSMSAQPGQNEATTRSVAPVEGEVVQQQPECSKSFLPLIQPLASSSSSFASSINLESDNEQLITTSSREFDPARKRRRNKTNVAFLDENDDRDGDESDNDGEADDEATTSRYKKDKDSDNAANKVMVSIDQPPANQAVAAVSSTNMTQERPTSQPVTSSTQSATQTVDIIRQKASRAPSSGVAMLSNNFRKLVKRQQSVDSYRMARDLKNKQKRQQESALRHQSNETIKDADNSISAIKNQHRKFSMRTVGGDASQLASRVREQANNLRNLNIKRMKKRSNSNNKNENEEDDDDEGGTVSVQHNEQPLLKICIDPYAKPGSFTLPGQDKMNDNGVGCGTSAQSSSRGSGTKLAGTADSTSGKKKVEVKPPNTLSLMPTLPAQQQQQQPGAFVVGSFSGCITPTYPTHHFPSPKYVSPSTAAAKKYSNASTISSLGGESSIANYIPSSGTLYYGSSGQRNGPNIGDMLTTGQSDTESSVGGSVTPSRLNNSANSPMNLIASAQVTGGISGNTGPQYQYQYQQQQQQQQRQSLVSCGSSRLELQSTASDLNAANTNNRPSLVSGMSDNPSELASSSIGQTNVNSAAAAAAMSNEEAAARRANLAEHIYDNKCGLGEDMKFLASLPELCDITFLVGETREPVCAVKSVLAARSRVFHKILFGNRIREQQRLAQQQQQQQQQQQLLIQQQQQQQKNRRGSSPKQSSHHKTLLGNKSSSPLVGSAAAAGVSATATANTSPSRTPSPHNNPQLQQWSVTSDASGYKPPIESGELVSRNSPSGGSKSGRVSVSRSGRGDSISQVSQTGSQQPLIIGPGQMAAPAKRTKKSSIRDSRLSRMFMRRASDPSIKPGNQLLLSGNQHGGSSSANNSNQNYLDKMSSSQMSTTMIIEEFEPDVFRQLIEYIHTGCVLLQARTLLGLLNAADYYGLEQLRKACLRFVSCCITVDTVCSLLSTAERYIQYKCTKSIVQKVLEFVDTHADEIFKLNAFGLLPEHVVRLILARDGLQADEQVKYSGVYTWCEHYCRSYELTNIADVMRNFLDLIQFHKIPTNVLLSEIYPTHIVPDNIFLSALAYQADPQNFEPQPSRARRMTLPNPVIYKDYDDDYDADDGDADADAEADVEVEVEEEDDDADAEDDDEDGNVGGRMLEQNEHVSGEENLTGSGKQKQQRKHQVSRFDSFLLLGKKRKSGAGISLFTGNAAQSVDKPNSKQRPANVTRQKHHNESKSSSSSSPSNKLQQQQQKARGTSEQLASKQHVQMGAHSDGRTKQQKAIINKTSSSSAVAAAAAATSAATALPLRARKSIGSQAEVSTPPAGKLATRFRKGSIAQVSISGVMRLSHKLSIKKRHSNLSTSTAASRNVVSGTRNGSIASSSTSTSHKHHALISRQQSMATSTIPKPISADTDPMEVGQKILNAYLIQQRQRELEEEKERLRKEELEKQAAKESKRRSEQFNSTSPSTITGGDNQSEAHNSGKQQPIVKVSSTRKSFRDFKHISRRLFMRNPSSKMLTSSLSSTMPPATSTTTTISSVAATATAVDASYQPATSIASATTAPSTQQQQRPIIGQPSIDA